MKTRNLVLIIIFILIAIPVLGEIKPLVFDYRDGLEITTSLQDIIDDNLDQFLATNEITKIERAFVGEGEKTMVILKLTPLRTLGNVKLYEEIPKSAARTADEINFKIEPTEIVSNDPLLMWQFAALDAPVEVSYELNKAEDQLLKDSFKVAAIAEEIGEEMLSPKRGFPLFIKFGVLLIAIVGLGLLFFMRKGGNEPPEEPPQEPEQPPQFQQFAQQPQYQQNYPQHYDYYRQFR